MMNNIKNLFPIEHPIVVLIGPTAIGKTALSIELAQRFNFEIIGVDSMQVYRYMDIGTAKITKAEMQNIPHHLIDVVTPDQPFDAVRYDDLALTALRDIIHRGKNVLITGGTGLYLRALLNGLSEQLPAFPQIRHEIQKQLQEDGCEVLHEHLSSIDQISAKRIHKNDTHRLVRAIEIYRGTGRAWSTILQEHKAESQLRFSNILIIGLTCERKKLYERIEQRCEIMIENGLEKEVEDLLKSGYSSEHQSMQSIGYSHMIKYLHREWMKSEMIERLKRDTRRYAKRQYTWFKKIEGLIWVDTNEATKVKPMIERFLKDTNTA